MIGAIEENPEDEHDIAPTLKLIDWGIASEIEDDIAEGPHLQRQAITENIYGIGKIMAELATLNHDLSRDIYPERPQETIFQLYPAGPYIRTTGVELFRDSVGDCPTPALDGHLRNLIGACLAVRRQDRPLLATLADQVITAIQERDADFYADLELNWGSQIDSSLESDAHIKTLVQELTVNASTTEALPNFMKTKYDMS